MAEKVFANIGDIPTNKLKFKKIGTESILKLSSFDERLPDIKRLTERYPAFRNGRPGCAVIDPGHYAWLCGVCHIVGKVYTRSTSKHCGYCGKEKTAKAVEMAWNIPRDNPKLSWVIEKHPLGTAFPLSSLSQFNLPKNHVSAVEIQRAGHAANQRSGWLFVLLKAIGVDDKTAMKMSAVALVWHPKNGSQKMKDVLLLLQNSGELQTIRDQITTIKKLQKASNVGEEDESMIDPTNDVTNNSRDEDTSSDYSDDSEFEMEDDLPDSSQDEATSSNNSDASGYSEDDEQSDNNGDDVSMSDSTNEDNSAERDTKETDINKEQKATIVARLNSMSLGLIGTPAVVLVSHLWNMKETDEDVWHVGGRDFDEDDILSLPYFEDMPGRERSGFSWFTPHVISNLIEMEMMSQGWDEDSLFFSGVEAWILGYEAIIDELFDQAREGHQIEARFRDQLFREWRGQSRAILVANSGKHTVTVELQIRDGSVHVTIYNSKEMLQSGPVWDLVIWIVKFLWLASQAEDSDIPHFDPDSITIAVGDCPKQGENIDCGPITVFVASSLLQGSRIASLRSKTWGEDKRRSCGQGLRYECISYLFQARHGASSSLVQAMRKYLTI